MDIIEITTPACNSTYKKLAFQWLNEALCFVSSSLLADSFVLRNRQLLVAAKRYQQFKIKTMKHNRLIISIFSVFAFLIFFSGIIRHDVNEKNYLSLATETI